MEMEDLANFRSTGGTHTIMGRDGESLEDAPCGDIPTRHRDRPVGCGQRCQRREV